MDGSVGLPGYSALFPNTMLAHSLVLVRDLLLSGSASAGLTAPTFLLSGYRTSDSRRDVLELQPNVRAVLAEMELLEGINFSSGSVESRTKVSSAGVAVITLTRPGFNVFKKQLERVLSYADLRGERVNEVLSQVVPQTAYWSAIAGLTPERHRYTLELLGVGLRFTMQVVMKLKLTFNVPRPMELSALVQPMILTPGYSAYPSGHATEATFAAELLSALLHEARSPKEKFPPPESTPRESLRPQLHRLAYRVAENRVVAGLHYPIDSMAGFALGIALARYAVARCEPKSEDLKKPLTNVSFPAKKAERSKDKPDAIPDTGLCYAEPDLDQPLKFTFLPEEPAALTVDKGTVLPVLWEKAVEEWKHNVA